MLFTFLLVVQGLVAAALVGSILMQKSEGGGLGVGGSSSGFMTARGQADFLTRATAILATVFVALSITLAAIAGSSEREVSIDTSLVNEFAPAAPVQPVEPVPSDTPSDDAAPIAE